MTVHGHGRRGGRTPTYQCWLSMRARCWNPRHARYADYGGRGVDIDPRWSTFVGFLRDMGERPEGHTLDRIDSDGPYAPGNCRWADASTQNRNRRRQLLAHCPCGYFAPHGCPCQGGEGGGAVTSTLTVLAPCASCDPAGCERWETCDDHCPGDLPRGATEEDRR